MVHTLRLDNYTPTPRKLVLGTNSSFGTESIQIERGAGWDGLALTATWHIPGREEPLRVALLDGDAMDVPPEVTKEARDGVLVLAGLASGVQRASCNVEYLILEQAGVYGGQDAEPTPELAAQVLEAALQAKADAEAAAEDAAAAKANANKAQQAAENAAADAAKAGPYAEAALAAQEAAEAARDEAIAAQRAAKNAAAAAAASKSAADTLAAAAARAAQAAENSKAAANNAANLAGENATAAQQAAATATAAANDAGQIASDAAASKAAAEAAAKAAQDAQTAAAAAKAEAVKAQVAAQTAAKSAQDAQTAAEKARDEAKAARDAAAKSAAAAKNSEDAAAKSAEDSDRTANSINESMTQIAANKEAIGQLKDGKISKFYASSQGDTNLPDSDAGRLVDLKLYGKSEQKQYSGKNLLPPITYSGNVSNLQIDAADGAVHLKGTPSEQVNTAIIGACDASSPIIFTLQAGTYTFSGFGEWLTTPRLNLVYVEDGNLISINGNTTTTFDKETNFIAVFVYTDANAALDITFKPMIEKGSTATDYEPYVGGIPSPNPEYPQEIKSVVNPTVKVCGSNIYDYENADETNTVLNTNGKENVAIGYITSDYIPVLDGIYIKGNNKSTDPLRIGLYTEKKEWKTRKDISNSILYVSSSDAKYIRLSYSTDSVTEIYASYDNIFEPYHEQTATLPYTLNAIPVTGGGNVTIDGQQYVADYVDVEGGKLVRRTIEKIYDGSENWTLEGDGLFFASPLPAGAKTEGTAKGSTCLLSIMKSISYKAGDSKAANGCCQMYNFRIYVGVSNQWGNVEGLKAWLSQNPTNALLEADASVETDLTADEIAAFKALASYYPVTNVSTTSDQLDGYTVFNYPISLANGWNYVKQQIGDTRDYLYDIDLVTAEAYVNSAYATAIAEMEV